MVRDFPKTKVILLEDNFRSTGSILKASYAIISQGPHFLPSRLRSRLARPDLTLLDLFLVSVSLTFRPDSARQRSYSLPRLRLSRRSQAMLDRGNGSDIHRE